MAIWTSLKSGIRALLHPSQRNQEIHEELEGYLAAAVEDKTRRGMDREAALRETLAEVGSAETVRHKVWSSGWEAAAESCWHDVRFGLRQLVKAPGFSIVAILSLALGIGANTAIFTLINDLLLKQLPVSEPQQLVSFGKAAGGGILGMVRPGPMDMFSYDFYKRLQQDDTQQGSQKHFQAVAAFASFPTMVSVRSGGTGPATQAMSHLVSGTFFPMLGAQPMLGRWIGPQDTEAPGRNAVAVISHHYWQQELASDPRVVGRSVAINGTLFTVIGVMPPNFYGVDVNEISPDMWLPLTMQAEVMLQPQMLDGSGVFWLHMMARRDPGTSLATAQAWVTARVQQDLTDREGTQLSLTRREEISRTYVPFLPGGAGISHLRSEYQAPLTVLMGIVGIVLLIACANLANFLMAKAAAREREFSTRLALGSSRIRILRQVLTETLMLACAGGALGLLLAFWGTRMLIRFIVGTETGMHTALAATPDMHVLVFTSAICILTGLLFGLGPALRVSRTNAAVALNANARTSVAAGGRSGRLLPNALVAGQVMLSLVLLAVAGLLLRTLHNLHSQDLGFDRTNLLMVETNPKFAGYKPEQLNALYDKILNRLDALPGVKSATLSGGLPMSHGNWGSPMNIVGRPAAPNEDVSTLLNRVGPDYFETLGIPLLQGRTIGAQDTPTSTHAVVVNQTFADRYFPHGDAVGRSFDHVADSSVEGTWQIVGVVRDSTYSHAGEVPSPMAYLAVEQLTKDVHYAYWLELRSAGDPRAIAVEVRTALRDVDANLPVLEVQTISEQLDTLIAQQILISQLSGFFALLALTLCAIGLYGVMSYSVARRTNEIGVRMAMGAQRDQVQWLILKESLGLLALGVLLGVPATLGAGRLIQAGLFGLGPSDPATLLGAVAIVAAVTIAAGYFPARRATKVDPMVALRYE